VAEQASSGRNSDDAARSGAAAHQSLENFTKVFALPLAASVQDEESSSRPSSEQTRGLHSLSRVLQVCFRSQWRRRLPFLPWTLEEAQPASPRGSHPQELTLPFRMHTPCRPCRVRQSPTRSPLPGGGTTPCAQAHHVSSPIQHSTSARALLEQLSTHATHVSPRRALTHVQECNAPSSHPLNIHLTRLECLTCCP